MRRTIIRKLECVRHRPYDENDHQILVRHGNVQYEAEKAEPGHIQLKVSFLYQVVPQGGGEAWGSLKGEAQVTIRDVTIKIVDGRIEGGDHMKAVIEGALADEIFLPLSLIARSMRLPGFLVMPQAEGTEDAQQHTA